jgi:hypothetical protein
LRASGATYRQIGDALGIDKTTAWRLVQQESESIIRESAAEVLELELTRLDRLQMGIWAEAISGDLAAVDRVLKIMEMRAKLLGLHRQAETDQPQRGRNLSTILRRQAGLFTERSAVSARAG